MDGVFPDGWRFLTHLGVADLVSYARLFWFYDTIGRAPFRLSLRRVLLSRACVRLAENL